MALDVAYEAVNDTSGQTCRICWTVNMTQNRQDKVESVGSHSRTCTWCYSKFPE